MSSPALFQLSDEQRSAIAEESARLIYLTVRAARIHAETMDDPADMFKLMDRLNKVQDFVPTLVQKHLDDGIRLTININDLPGAAEALAAPPVDVVPTKVTVEDMPEVQDAPEPKYGSSEVSANSLGYAKPAPDLASEILGLIAAVEPMRDMAHKATAASNQGEPDDLNSALASMDDLLTLQADDFQDSPADDAEV